MTEQIHFLSFFLFKGQAKVNLIATRFCVSLEASKKEVNISRLF